MSPLARSALAAAAALASFAAPAREFPPMDIMGPYDTPDAAAERIVVPELPGDLARRHGEAGIENANAGPPDVRDAAMPVLEVRDVLSVRARDERGERDDEGERDKDGHKPGGRDGG